MKLTIQKFPKVAVYIFDICKVEVETLDSEAPWEFILDFKMQIKNKEDTNE